MSENSIICPHCNQVFEPDASAWANISKQVRDKAFKAELAEREKAAVDLAEKSAEAKRLETISGKDREISDLNAKHRDEIGAKDVVIAQLEEKLKAAERDKEAAVNVEREKATADYEADLTERDREIFELKAKLDNAESDKKLAVIEAEKKSEETIRSLETKLRDAESNGKLALADASKESDRKIHELEMKLESNARDAERDLAEAKSRFELEMKLKDEEVERYRDFKIKLSTKAIGESLEQHCESEFNKIRALGFQGAYFGKDNEISEQSGSKGDYIYRDYTPDGVEFISIMFEMKNEADATATKKKNSDFLKELDKDRNEKKCEYAILVSMLESDSELYNAGIVDMSHAYPKMYVIRPQFFVPIITLLRNAAMANIEAKRDLERLRSEQADLFNFEDNLNAFKEKFGKNCAMASKHFANVISEIDKAVDHLNKVREALMSTDRSLSLANGNVDKLSVRSLTKNSPGIRFKLEEIAAAKSLTTGEDDAAE